MKTKIKYESTKRQKDIARSKIAYQKYAKRIDEPVELQIYEELHHFFHKENVPAAGAIQEIQPQVCITFFRAFITLQQNIGTILIMISVLLFSTIGWVLFIMQWHIKKCSRLVQWMKL